MTKAPPGTSNWRDDDCDFHARTLLFVCFSFKKANDECNEFFDNVETAFFSKSRSRV
jgi:hypothetical protein